VSLPFSKSDTDTTRGRPTGENAGVIDPLHEAGLRFSISQPLLRNAGIRASTHAIRVAKYQKEIADARTKLEAIRILANADRAYWYLYAARRELEVSQGQYELAMQQLDQARQRVEAGDAPQIEIMRAESGVARRLEAIIIADTEVRRLQRDLKRIAQRQDLPLNSPTVVIPKSEPNPVGLDLDAEALAEYAVDKRMEMLELELQLAADASTVDFERNGTLPLFTLDYSYTINGLSGNRTDAFRDIRDGSFADYSIGLSAEIPLGNEAAKSRVRRAVLQRIQRLATRVQRRLAIRQEVYDAVDQLEQSWQRILAARQEVILAGRTYEAEKRQFEVGLRTSTEVLDAAAQLAGAQSREIRALAAYEVAQVDIAFASGALLGHGEIIWEPTPLP
jgi:outer membrane protein TolC